MASLFCFSGISEKEVNAHVQKTVPEETKVATTYGFKISKGKKKTMHLKYQFDSFSRQ